ncbi:non-ribosomal peptide synthetase [Kineosporia mesophila]|uniref:non-ribosomal peptide synthetase n=1 Tax=Kineosporia mesophila TaxID=566012 RepID=UPI001E403E57|nr:amino acid adenylation domain-containing protein [Kineosporia mesophila]
MASAVRAVQEVARRLDRDLIVVGSSVERSVAAALTVCLTTSDGGPVIRCIFDEKYCVSYEIELSDGDPWAPATTAVVEMCTQLTQALLADPDLDPTAAPALSRATEAAVLGPLAGVTIDHGPFRGVPAQVSDMARRTPELVAVHATDGTLTYGELVAHARRLAVRIIAAAPAPGSLIPVLVADGLALPVAWAGAMFAGVGYVPVDPHWPASRIERVLDLLAGAPVLCTDPDLMPAHHRDRALVVEVSATEKSSGIKDGVVTGPHDVVYGVYTSGTTGTPLCAVNSHGALANRLAFMTSWFGPAPAREVVLQNTRHTYDSAFWQIFWPLTTGGATVVPTAGEHRDLQHTIDLIETHGVTVTDFVPALLNALLSLLEQRPALVGRLRSLRHLVVGGEQINPHDVHRLQRLLPGLRVSNGYGPSEAAIGMIFHEVTEADGDDVPLGRPVDNCGAVVVDVDGRPLPPGATGEIVIGGVCVGLGYHGEIDRSAQRFFDCPWPGAGPVLTGRLYRTGDLGHLDERGRFHFSGRIDHQIKVGGVRIEPGEVEAAALSLPGVRQAVALVVGPATGRELVLVVTGTVPAAEVLTHLGSRLPRSSVPQRCLVLEEIPLTAAGKTDRRQLALEAELADVAGAADLDDRTDDEVLRVLRTAMRRPRLRAHDDVFAAGANSLLMVAAVVALTDRFGVEIGVRDLVDHPTAAGLRELITRRELDHERVPEEAALVAADLADLTGPVPARRERRDQPVRTVLLTGATGFVGTHLLHELLDDPDLTVVCLVRAPDDDQARRRLDTALTGQQLDHPGFTGRVRAVAGDLSRPGLGLSPEQWSSLAQAVDLVVHNGAMVNFLYDYRMHRDPNVRGTAELIRFAREAGGVPLHYISTLGVLHDHAMRTPGVLGEDVDLAGVTAPRSGYSRSKWVAERLLNAATDLPVTVLRLGEVMPAVRPVNPAGPAGPIANPTAVTHLLLQAFEQLGAVPRAAIRSDYTPVDAVARTVAEAVRDTTVWGGVLHVFRPGSVRFDELAEFPVTPRVACTRFLADLRVAAAGDTGLSTLLAVIDHRAGGGLDDEDTARAVLENLLQDNPACFDRTAGAAFEQRHGLNRHRVPAALAQ